jgi:hypothetical protein
MQAAAISLLAAKRPSAAELTRPSDFLSSLSNCFRRHPGMKNFETEKIT